MVEIACPDLAQLQQLLFGRLPSAESGTLKEHLLKCPTCTQALRALRARDRRPAVAETPSVAEPPTPPVRRPGKPHMFLAPPCQEGEIGRLGPYRVLQVLGAGGMGVVFRAEDPHLRRPIALK